MQATLTNSAYLISNSVTAQEIFDHIQIFKFLGGNVVDLPATVIPMWYQYGYISQAVFEMVVEQGLGLTHNHRTLTGVKVG